MVEKPRRIVIRCSEETYLRFRELFGRSGCSDYEEFLNILLDLYACLGERYGEKKIVQIRELVCETPIIVKPL